MVNLLGRLLLLIYPAGFVNGPLDIVPRMANFTGVLPVTHFTPAGRTSEVGVFLQARHTPAARPTPHSRTHTLSLRRLHDCTQKKIMHKHKEHKKKSLEKVKK